MGPGLRALPRSKPLRFSGTPQRHRLNWSCLLCHPRFEQLRRPGAWRVHSSQVGQCVLSPPWSQRLSFLSVKWECHLRCAMCLLWGAVLWLPPSWQMSTVQDPRNVWLATGRLLTVWLRMLVSGAELDPCLPALAAACLPLVGHGLVHSLLALPCIHSVLCSVSGPQCLR